MSPAGRIVRTPNPATRAGPVRRASLLPACTCLLALLLLWLARPASAQVLSGRVVDASSGDGVPGAIVVAEGPDGDVSVETLTNREGGFTVRLTGPSEPAALRVERIGYATQRFDADAFSIDRYSVLEVSTSPIELEGITALAENLCGSDIRGDPTLYGVWLEVRKGLQTSQLGQSQEILTFDTESFARSVNPRTGDVTTGSLDQRRLNARTPYRAISVDQMVDDGWAEDQMDGTTMYYAPNAELLLTDEFNQQHCFNADRTGEGILLHFEPNRERAGIPDIEGEMVLDSASMALTEIRFDYVGIRGLEDAEEARPTGEIHFYGAPNGLRMIRDWTIRMPVVTILRNRFTGSGQRLRVDYIREVGGRVLSVRTREGTIPLVSDRPEEEPTPPPLEPRLQSWKEDAGPEGAVLYLQNGLSTPVMITGVDLRDCVNVDLSCEATHPIQVRVEPAEFARLFTVPRVRAAEAIDFMWSYTATNADSAGPDGN